ncbi:hypothetical protein V3C99_010553, partial [Haemonchus contortus]
MLEVSLESHRYFSVNARTRPVHEDISVDEM